MEIQTINEIIKAHNTMVFRMQERLIEMIEIHGPDTDKIRRNCVWWKYDPSKEPVAEEEDPATEQDHVVFDVLERFKDLSLEELMGFIKKAADVEEEHREENEQDLERRCIEYLEEWVSRPKPPAI